jgi:hypothetical protein
MKPAILAAHHVAEQYGIVPDRCVVLQDAHTIVVRITDTLVARIVTDTTGPRSGTAWLACETAIAAHLSHRRAPIIPLHPALPPTAHEHDGYAMNFWTYVTAVDAPPAPADMARTLHQCHRMLSDFDQALPALAILHESLTILEQEPVQRSLTQESIALLSHHLIDSLEKLAPLPQQVLHGDAHMGNLMMTTDGLLWSDWEDAFLGPIEWDIASLIWNAQLLENDHATVSAILESYQAEGTAIDRAALDQCLIARAAVMSAWYPLLYPQPSPERQRKLQQRLDWLRQI